MENETENFEQLKKLLALKKHEQPPPGYFNKFSGHVISSIRADRAGHADSMSTLKTEAPWLLRFWQALEAKPLFAGAFGAAVCAVILLGIVMAEKPVDQNNLGGPRVPMASALAGAPGSAGGDLNQPIMLATNQAVPDLFQLIPNGQTAPVSFTP